MIRSINEYLKQDLDFPYCAGCGHTMINKAVASAFAKSGLKPTEINLISDIGCVGLVDKMFLTNTIHTTHGRSTAFATGIQLADEILFDSNSLNVVMIGDGGATIGLLHLVEAAKMNANITVVLHNNFVYGMTGGQNSGLTPENFRTATTMSGNLVPNIHIAKLLEASHAGFIARKLATDKDLDQTMLEAFNYNGFALVEIVELCTGYATKWNSLSKKDIEVILENSDQEERGVIVEKPLENFARKYKSSFKTGTKYKQAPPIQAQSEFEGEIDLSIVIAGTAGEGIQFTSSNLAKSFVLQGLNISQKNDNPVTIGTGYSLSELKISSSEILYSAIDEADYLIVCSEDGLARVRNELKKAKKLIIDSALLPLLDQAELKELEIIKIEARSQVKDKRLASFVLVKKLLELESIDITSLLETIKANSKASEELLEILEN